MSSYSRQTKEVLVCCSLRPFLCLFLAQVVPCLLSTNISKPPPRRVRLLVAYLTGHHFRRVDTTSAGLIAGEVATQVEMAVISSEPPSYD